MKNVLKPLTKGVLIPLGLTAAASAADAGIVKIFKSLEDSGLLLKGVSKIIQNEAKEVKGGFLNMSLGTLGASLLCNVLAAKGMNRARERFIRASYGSSVKKEGF